MLEDHFLLFLLATATAPQIAATGTRTSAAPVGGLGFVAEPSEEVGSLVGSEVVIEPVGSEVFVELVGSEVVVELVGSEVGSSAELFA